MATTQVSQVLEICALSKMHPTWGNEHGSECEITRWF